MWKISKFFRIPLNDQRLQDLTPYELEFYEYSMIVDDPKKLEQFENHFSDPEFDDWLEEFELEQQMKAQNDDSSDENSSDGEISNNGKITTDMDVNGQQEGIPEYDEDYELPPDEEITDWERDEE